MRALAYAFAIAGQAADILTYLAMDDRHAELNPIVIALGPFGSLLCKVGLVALVLLLDDTVKFPSTLAVVLFAGALGFVGALSNVL